MTPTKCKKCPTEILWVVTPNGKRTPVDAKPIRVAMLREEAGGVLKIEEVAEGHQTHWATCPAAKEFKK